MTNLADFDNLDDLIFDKLIFDDVITAGAEANAEDLLDELDANELAEALGLSETADAEVAGLANLFIQCNCGN